jgi:undecaprenyl phosphate-alpha-L-ara4FN deformylase
MPLGIRVDIDSAADAIAIPKILDILREREAKATFFITTGPDKSGRNFHRYLFKSPRDQISAIKRYGLKNILLGNTPFAKSIESFDYSDIIGEGHEIGLHGYDHLSWTRKIEKMEKYEIKNTIKKGIKVFQKKLGILPACFASPGFKISKNYLRVVDSFGFQFCSDFISEKPFFPKIDGWKAKTLQVPISVKSIGELREEKLDDMEILRRFQDKGKTITFYLHPSYEAIFEEKLLRRIIQLHNEYKTLGEIAREYYENSPNI